ncbi:ribonuclease HI [Methylobacterium organophilum]|uniref:Ribonuclease H n=1 Tax=Methylobacterium organophilum TaxID=410 RepID=A0ABQ4TF42_METOR|nr:ribonuclease HI [Methylobacterium organophilum]GJE29344.1 Ribonuclease H [Methylobacterium organophilum]
MRTIVYADGGCDPNPGPGGWGVVIQHPTGTVELHGGERATTNNRMELTAAISALEHFPEGAAIEMRCDSQYVVKSVTEWMKGWKRKGWRTATGPVKNRDLMERLDALASARDVRWTWVRGHAGEVGNERADRLAAQGRREALERPTGAPSDAPAPVQAPAPVAAESTPAAPPRTTEVRIGLGLGLEVSRAAKRAGLSPQAFVEEAVQLALDLGPEGRARARASLLPARET